MSNVLTFAAAAAHIDRCRAAVAADPEAFGRVLFLAQASARVRTERFWPHLSEIFAQFVAGTRHPVVNGKELRDIFSLGAKWRGISHNWNSRRDIFAAVSAARTREDKLKAIAESAEWLSTVKGGFVLQMCGLEVGCIDSVNKRLYGIGAVTSSPARYVALCDTLGGSVALWANWCNAVAEQRGACAVAISEAHASFIETGRCAPLTFGNVPA